VIHVQSDVIPREAMQWRDQAVGRVFGRIRIEDAGIYLDDDANGLTAVFLDLTLSNPPDGADTWPIDDVLALHDALNEDARRLRFGLPWHVRLSAVDEEPLDDEDDASAEDTHS
jgi:hypothetical protein